MNRPKGVCFRLPQVWKPLKGPPESPSMPPGKARFSKNGPRHPIRIAILYDAAFYPTKSGQCGIQNCGFHDLDHGWAFALGCILQRSG